MILREWRARADYGQENAYPMHFRARVVPELREIPGFIGADLLERDIGQAIEFTVFTRWASMDAVRAFACCDVSKAIVEPRAVEALRDYDELVSHHEVLDSFASNAG